MTQPLSFDHLQAILRQHTAGLPDVRKPSPNTRYTIQNAALGAFGIFFMQSPSFLEYQRQLNQCQGHDNAQTLFGVEPIPCDNQIRTLLDPIAPRYFTPSFLRSLHTLSTALFRPIRVLDHQLLVSLDGTQSFPPKPSIVKIVSRVGFQRSNLYYIGDYPVIVCPGHAQVIALAPAYIMPQDGHDKQDCEQAAGKRWITQHAATLAPHHVTLMGDDLYSKEPFCALALQQGFNFILVCKPDSHTKFYERLAFWQAQGQSPNVNSAQAGALDGVATIASSMMSSARGKQARSVNWVEMIVVNAKRANTLFNTFITNHRLSAENVAQVAQAGRGRWKIENENNNVLKTKGYHLEHNFGHGKQYLSATMLSLNLLAFLFHTVLEWSDAKYALLRQVLARRQTFFEDMRALTRYMVFESWHHLMDFMLKGLKLESKLALKLRPNLDTS